MDLLEQAFYPDLIPPPDRIHAFNRLRQLAMPSSSPVNFGQGIPEQAHEILIQRLNYWLTIDTEEQPLLSEAKKWLSPLFEIKSREFAGGHPVQSTGVNQADHNIQSHTVTEWIKLLTNETCYVLNHLDKWKKNSDFQLMKNDGRTIDNKTDHGEPDGSTSDKPARNSLPPSKELLLLTPQKGKLSCQYCNRLFKSQKQLDLHLLAHEQRKLKLCRQCGGAYVGLSRHIATHSGERPYQCEQCGKRFTLNGALTSHSLVHKKDKPYTGEKCRKQTATLNDLQAHQSKYNGKNRVPLSPTLTTSAETETGNITRIPVTDGGEIVGYREKPLPTSIPQATVSEPVSVQTSPGLPNRLLGSLTSLINNFKADKMDFASVNSRLALMDKSSLFNRLNLTLTWLKQFCNVYLQFLE
ncbi:MAG: C2H2-type zinc finger protein, partial [Cytophagales bacterium]|nr:C2H2-type zinc finger protein [Cytophagales bacterium]